MEQTFASGRRLSIIGFLQQQISFVYGQGDWGCEPQVLYSQMEQEAVDAEKTGRTRVIVQDNGSIHQCREVQKLGSKWERMGLYILFLPKYCSPMNPIQLEWQHLKKDELSGKTFEDELDRAYGVIYGVQARGERGNYSTQRVKFNSERTG